MTEATAFRQIPRPDPAELKILRGIPAADLHDEMSPVEQRLQLMHHSMRPVLPSKRFFGPAVTAYCMPGDNLMMHAALFVAQPGDVLIVSNGGVAHGALWGGNATRQAVRKGLAALVADGPIRDIAQIRNSDFGVWSTSIAIGRPSKSMPGTLNVPVMCAGVLVHPGDIIVGDEDAVIVLAPAQVQSLAAAARARIERDERTQVAIAGGATLFERLGGEDAMRKLGLDMVDGTWRDRGS